VLHEAGLAGSAYILYRVGLRGREPHPRVQLRGEGAARVTDAM